jgi:predicted RNase H-like HicB family nuclease
MKKLYLGAVNEDEGSFGIVFKDLPGCVSCGDSLEEALAMGAEALQGHIEAMQDGGDFIPTPSQHELGDVLTWLDEENDPSGGQWLGLFPVEADVSDQPGSVSIPVEAEIVHEISAALERGGSGLSPRAFIEQATRRELVRLKKSA